MGNKMYTGYKTMWQEAFFRKKGCFSGGKGIVEGRRKTKRKAPDTLGRCCYFLWYMMFDFI